MINRKLLLLCAALAISISSSLVTAGAITYHYSSELAYTEIMISANQQASLTDCECPNYRLAMNNSKY